MRSQRTGDRHATHDDTARGLVDRLSRRDIFGTWRMSVGAGWSNLIVSVPIMSVAPRRVGRNCELMLDVKTRTTTTMPRSLINLLLDIFLLVVFLALAWVSVILRFVFPQGTIADGWSLWGEPFDWWSHQQFNIISLLALAILVHVMLHWSWVCGTISHHVRFAKAHPRAARTDDGTRTLYGVAVLLVIVNVLGLLIAAAALSIRGPGTS